MSNVNLFLKTIKKLYDIDSFNEEETTYLSEVFTEIDAVLERPVAIYSTYNMLFSEVEIERVFTMGGEAWCKVSEIEYVHMTTREKMKIAGDPVVMVTEREQ